MSIQLDATVYKILLQVVNNCTCFGRMRPSSGVIVYITAAKWCSGVSVVEGTAWVAVVWKRVVAEGVTLLLLL
jgi:hypothetical protein